MELGFFRDSHGPRGQKTKRYTSGLSSTACVHLHGRAAQQHGRLSWPMCARWSKCPRSAGVSTACHACNSSCGLVLLSFADPAMLSEDDGSLRVPAGLAVTKW
jgi:hypothetical protein